MNKYLSLLIGISFSLFVHAQKSTLNHDVYDDWRQINSTTVSKSGLWAAIQIDPQEGDGEIQLFRENKKTTTFTRGYKLRFSPDETSVLFLVRPENEVVRQAKRDGKKKDDLPKDHFVIYHLNSGKLDTIKNVLGYDMPSLFGNWYSLKLAKEKKSTKETDTTSAEKTDALDAAKSKKKKDTEKGDVVVLRNFSDTTSITIERVTDFVWPDSAKVFYYSQAKKDSATPASIWSLSLTTQKPLMLDSGRVEYLNLVANQNGKYFTYMGTSDSADAEIKTYDWFFLVSGKKRWMRSGIWNDSLVISKDYKPIFTDDNSRLYFGLAMTPKPEKKDTLQLDEEKVNLDLWSWNDPYIQPMQLKNKSDDLKKSFRMVYWINENKSVPLANAAVPEINFSKKFPTVWLAGYNDEKYKIRATWEIPTPRDLYIVNSLTGKKRVVTKEVKAYGEISPDGQFLFWYDSEAQFWMLYHIESKVFHKASANMPYPVFDEDWDTPAPPRAYGDAGFTEKDSLFVFYDRYDLWGYHFPTKTLTCLTEGKGREQKIQLRYQKVTSEINHLEWEKGIYLKGFNEITKGHSIHLGKAGSLETLLEGAFQIQQFEKAKDAQVFYHRRGNFQDYPEVYRSTDNFDKAKRLTRTNPQQADYNWATVELVSWTAFDGTKLEGLLYKPENFDPKEKYPLMVYFYETYSENLHRHYTPQPSWSIINIPYYASNGYIVFVPDIKYKTGDPGGSAYNCILSGVAELEKEVWIDTNKMAIQGQSWGGYQVAWLVTQTDKFAAAMAGAPVSNMTSAYGGIRWGSGMARAFQYEQTQSRLGTTMWEDRETYINNSPLFFADKVTTPLLIMHNDKDQAVPWYQGIEYFVALRRLQKPAWMLVYNGEAHNLRERHNRKDLTIRMQQFFDHYLKDAPQPVWLKHGIPAIDKGKEYGLELLE